MNRHGRAFTIVELLVVTSIIVLLIAILLPSMQQARYVTRVTVCGAQMGQHLPMFVSYAVDHAGQFTNQGAADWPNYAKNYPGRPYNNTFHELNSGGYMPNADLLICPINSKQWGNWHADTSAYVSGKYTFGGWTSGARIVSVAAGWYWGFHSTASYNGAGPLTGERVSETGATRMMVTHRMLDVPSGYVSGRNYYDEGHRGSGIQVGGTKGIVSTDTPVLFSDGHVEVHYGDDVQERHQVKQNGLTYSLYY